MKALILEDNFSLAQSLQNILSAEDWEVQITCSWNEAAGLMNKNSFDLLVLDILLPDEKGFEILKILSQDKAYSSLKIAIISGFVNATSVYNNIPPSLKNNCIFFKKPIGEKIFLNFAKEVKFTLSDTKEMPLLEFFFERGALEKTLVLYLPQNKTFDSKELIACVFLAHLKEFTGDFKIIIQNEKESRIQFYNGHITRVSSANNTSVLGAILVEHGLSLPKDIETLLENTKSNKMIGERLVEKELLSPYMLNFMLKEQIKIRLSEIMSHPSFQLSIIEKPSENHELPDIDFNETDLMEWAADSLQTELTEDFFKSFYLEMKSNPIQKSHQINQPLVLQKQFLQDYNSLFKTLEDGYIVEDIINKSKNKNHTLRLLYFGLLTKSINLQNTTKEFMDEKKMDQLLDSIIEKDSDDLFAILNLPWNASVNEVERNYKQLVQKIHPDLLPVNASRQLKEKNEKAFKKITKSHLILKSEEKRKEYFRAQKEENFVAVMNIYEEGLTQIKQEKYKLAFKTLRPITNNKHAPSNTFLYVLWAKIKSKNRNLMDNRPEAAKIRKTIDSCPISLRTSPLFWYVKGLFYAQTEHYEKAHELFQKSLTVQKDFVEAKKELIFVKQMLKISRKKDKKNILNLFWKKLG